MSSMEVLWFSLQPHATIGIPLGLVRQSTVTASPSLLSITPDHPLSMVSHAFLFIFTLKQVFKHR